MPTIRRVRQHVNPLSSKYANPADVPDWSKVWINPDLPLHVDIGCGKGDFVREMAAQMPDWNFLGLEIRQPLVERALLRRDRDQQANLHFVFAMPTIRFSPYWQDGKQPAPTPAHCNG